MTLRLAHLGRVILLGVALALSGVPGLVAALPQAASVTFVHINDVYEIDTLAGGREGGLARVATLIDRQRARGPVLATLGGDFLSPSAAGTVVIDGQPLEGRHTVDVLNAMGLQWATLGNHEFDVSEASFRARMAEARFTVVVSNATDADGRQFDHTVPHAIVPIRVGGRTVRIGLIGLILDQARRPWVRYLPVVDTAKAQVAALKGRVDAIVAITHLPLLTDRALVEAVPEIDLVLGGHEHENVLVRRSRRYTPIVKADSNALTAAVVTLTFPASAGRPAVAARLEAIDSHLPKKPAVEARVRYWMAAVYAAFERNGFTPGRLVTNLPVELDGRTTLIRYGPSLLADLAAAGMRREADPVDVAIVNTGTLRIDDVIPPGPLTEYDVIRILPFPNKVVRVQMDGALLTQTLQVGAANVGSGGFLKVDGAERTGSGWTIGGRPIDPAARYSVATLDFLLTGQETGLSFLTAANPQVHDVETLRDMRPGFIAELQARYGAPR